jgi:hypothetical protein
MGGNAELVDAGQRRQGVGPAWITVDSRSALGDGSEQGRTVGN